MAARILFRYMQLSKTYARGLLVDSTWWPEHGLSLLWDWRVGLDGAKCGGGLARLPDCFDGLLMGAVQQLGGER